jgi:hypothetical protein
MELEKSTGQVLPRSERCGGERVEEGSKGEK